MRRILPIALVVVAIVVPSPSTAEDAGAPPDYSDLSGLSEVRYEVVRERIRVPMRDGERIFAEVVRPAASGRFGTILELSPYNGGFSTDAESRGQPQRRNGGLPGAAGGLAGYFAPRGYAVVLADVRGTGDSDGCMDYMGPVDRLDAYDLVEWLARQSWSSGRVGMTGVSYVGSTPIFAASMQPPHLKTIVPVAGLAQMYDHQFQAGVPYYLQWAGAMGTYDALAQQPADSGDERYARTLASYGCGVPNSALMNNVDLATGRYTPWHQARDFRDAAVAADIPVFMVQGFRDGSVRQIAMEWFTRRSNPGDKAWFGQWGHQASDRDAQWRGVLHRWFDKQLLERDVDTGPPVEVFLNEGYRPIGEDLWEPVPPPVRTAKSWPGKTTRVTYYPWADGTLRREAPPAGQVLIQADRRFHGMTFRSEAMTADVEIAGFPETRLQLALPDGRRIDVFAILFDEGPVDQAKVTQATINPELRNALGVVHPIIPGEVMDLRPPTQPLDHIVRAGHRLALRINSYDPDKAPTFNGPGFFDLHLGDATSFSIPVVDEPVLYTDPRG